MNKIVFVHGNSCSFRVWDHQLKDPRLAQFDMHAIHLPGHDGDRSRPERGYSIAGLVAGICEFAARVDAEEAVFVGHSLGGHLLLEAAPKLTRARGMMVIGTPPLEKPADFSKVFTDHPVAASIFKGAQTDAELDAWAEGFFPRDPMARAAAREDLVLTDPRFREDLGADIAVHQHYLNEVEVIQRLSVPFALLVGENDPFVRRDYLEALRSPTMWKGGLQVVPGAAHFPQIDTPDGFDALLASFASVCFD